MAKQRINCPHCGNLIEVLDDWNGMEVQCPVCGRRFFNYNSAAVPDAPRATMLTALNKYAVFTGRASRREYWLFIIFQNLVQLAAMLICFMASALPEGILMAMALVVIFNIAMFVPGLAVAVRRCHDTGHSGWYLLINLIPCIGPLVFLIMLCAPSYQGENIYGNDPNAGYPDESWPVAAGILLSVAVSVVTSLCA